MPGFGFGTLATAVVGNLPKVKKELKRKFITGKFGDLTPEQRAVRNRLKRSFETNQRYIAGNKLSSNKKKMPRQTKRHRRSSKGKAPKKRTMPKIITVPYAKNVTVRLTSWHQVTMDPGASGLPSTLVVTPSQLLDPLRSDDSVGVIVQKEQQAKWLANYMTNYSRYEPLSATVSAELIGADVTQGMYYLMLPSGSAHHATDLSRLQTVTNYPVLKQIYGSKLTSVLTSNSSGGQNANHVKMHGKPMVFKKIEGIKKDEDDDGLQFSGFTGSSATAASSPQREPVMFVTLGVFSGTSNVSLQHVLVKVSTVVRFYDRIEPTSASIAQ